MRARNSANFRARIRTGRAERGEGGDQDAQDALGAAGRYMECFMDWQLIARSERELGQVFADLPQAAFAPLHTFRDAPGCVVYALVERIAE